MLFPHSGRPQEASWKEVKIIDVTILVPKSDAV